MPTLATCTVVGHLYREPEPLKGESPGASFGFWTSDKVKNKDGAYDKKFTSFRGFLFGKTAEWLLKDGRKGSLVVVTGTFRLSEFARKDGTPGNSIEIRASEARVLDGEREENAQAAPVAMPPRIAKPALPTDIGGGINDNDPPFMRFEHFGV